MMPARAAIRMTLLPSEVAYCRRIASERDERNRRAGVVDRKNSHRSAAEIGVEGVLGEYVFGRMMGRSVEQMEDLLSDTTPRGAATDKDQDLRLDDHSTVDVKTTYVQRADLHIPLHKKRNPATYYALVIRETPLVPTGPVHYSYRGYVRGADAMIPENIQHVPRRQNMPFYVVPQHALIPHLPA